MKEIKLTRGFVSLIDDEDYDNLTQYKWHVKNGYAGRHVREGSRQKLVYMHRNIMQVTDAETIVIHKNENTLDNRKINLIIGRRKDCKRAKKSDYIRKDTEIRVRVSYSYQTQIRALAKSQKKTVSKLIRELLDKEIEK